MNNKKMSMNN